MNSPEARDEIVGSPSWFAELAIANTMLFLFIMYAFHKKKYAMAYGFIAWMIAVDAFYLGALANQ